MRIAFVEGAENGATIRHIIRCDLPLPDENLMQLALWTVIDHAGLRRLAVEVTNDAAA